MAEHARAFAPGRVNLIGEHTDYNEGLALPFAIAQGTTVTARRRAGTEIEAIAVGLGEEDRFPAAAPPRAPGWRAFVRGIVGELADAGVELPAARVEIVGTVPRGAGLSSSASLAVALALALLELADAAAPPPRELATLCSIVEREWVGAQTGLLDQLASLCGSPGRALEVDFRSLRVRRVPLKLAGHTLVALPSGERHALAGSGYNRRREECAQACALLGVGSLREATPRAAAALPEPLASRARHVIEENGRVARAVSELEAGRIDELGHLLDESHASLRDLYEVSTPAVERTVGRLRAAGALGARILGGGFGGSVLGLLPPGAEPPDGAVRVRPSAGAHLWSE